MLTTFPLTIDNNISIEMLSLCPAPATVEIIDRNGQNVRLRSLVTS